MQANLQHKTFYLAVVLWGQGVSSRPFSCSPSREGRYILRDALTGQKGTKPSFPLHFGVYISGLKTFGVLLFGVKGIDFLNANTPFFPQPFLSWWQVLAQSCATSEGSGKSGSVGASQKGCFKAGKWLHPWSSTRQLWNAPGWELAPELKPLTPIACLVALLVHWVVKSGLFLAYEKGFYVPAVYTSCIMPDFFPHLQSEVMRKPKWRRVLSPTLS